MANKVILEQNINLGVAAKDWQDAMRQSGRLLVASHFIKSEYIEATIRTVETYGPYIVIAPGLALAHSRPDGNVLAAGISLVTLKDPVNFNCDFDPVDIVMTLAAKDATEHQEMLRIISLYLSEEGRLDSIRSCTSAHDLANAINEYEPE
jgi:Phosphotransferase system mannitol/fructose-specific IIA domain (Ntr-type)